MHLQLAGMWLQLAVQLLLQRVGAPAWLPVHFVSHSLPAEMLLPAKKAQHSRQGSSMQPSNF